MFFKEALKRTKKAKNERLRKGDDNSRGRAIKNVGGEQ